MNFPHHNLRTRINFASASPAQTRRPAEKGRKFTELVTTWPSPSIWRCGLNLVGSSQQLGSMWTAIRLGTTTVSFGTRYPASRYLLECNEEELFQRHFRGEVFPWLWPEPAEGLGDHPDLPFGPLPLRPTGSESLFDSQDCGPSKRWPNEEWCWRSRNQRWTCPIWC